MKPELRRRPDLDVMQSGLLAALSNQLSRAAITNNMLRTFSLLNGGGVEDSRYLTSKVMSEVEGASDIRIAEANLQALFEDLGLVSALHEGLAHRAELILQQIGPYLPRHGHIIDIGCGDGQVTQLIHDRVNPDIEGVDICAYPAEGITVPINRFDGQRVLLPNGSCAAVVMTNVLHHARLNGWLLSEAHRLLRDDGVGIILETVPCDGTREEFLRTLFIDWLYNRGFHPADIAVPGKYETLQGWITRFRTAGLEAWGSSAEGELPPVVDLGMDQDLIPDQHVLYALKKMPPQ